MNKSTLVLLINLACGSGDSKVCESDDLRHQGRYCGRLLDFDTRFAISIVSVESQLAGAAPRNPARVRTSRKARTVRPVTQRNLYRGNLEFGRLSPVANGFGAACINERASERTSSNSVACTRNSSSYVSLLSYVRHAAVLIFTRGSRGSRGPRDSSFERRSWWNTFRWNLNQPPNSKRHQSWNYTSKKIIVIFIIWRLLTLIVILNYINYISERIIVIFIS